MVMDLASGARIRNPVPPLNSPADKLLQLF
jgi:hypothetical protein